jgi:hypothetical protein
MDRKRNRRLQRLQAILAVAGFIIFSGAFGYGMWQAVSRPSYSQLHATASPSVGGGEATHPRTSKPSFLEKTFDDPIALYTLLLAVFTGALVAVTVGQIGFLIRTDKTARLTAEAAKVSADAAVAINRPFILIEQVESGLKAEPGKVAFGFYKYNITNCGRTPAQLLEFRDDVRLSRRGIVMPPPLLENEGRRHRLPIGVVVTRDKPFAISGLPFPALGDEAPGIMTRLHSDPSLQLFLIGAVRWVDVFGDRFETGFCSWFNKEENRFFLIGGEKYNYTKSLSSN